MQLNKVLLQLLDDKDLKIPDVVKHSGMAYQSIKGALEGEDTNSLKLVNSISFLTETTIEEILNMAGIPTYSSGKSMITSNRVVKLESDKGPLIKNIKYIPQPVQAGYLSGFSDDNNKSMFIHIPGFEDKKDCIAFPVINDSMAPLISSGDILVCRKLEDKSEIRFGNVFVVVDEDGIVVKRLIKSDDDNYIEMHSDNHVYAPYPVEKSKIKAVYVVLGFISQNTSPRGVVHLTKNL